MLYINKWVSGFAVAAAAVSLSMAAPAAHASTVTIDPGSLTGVTGVSSFQADAYSLKDYATITINDTTGAFTETGTLQVLNFSLGSSTLLATQTGLMNGTGSSSYGLYLTFSASGTVTQAGGGFNPSGINVGSFSSVTYTMVADPGNTDTVSSGGVLTDTSGNDEKVASGSLNGGINTVSVISNDPSADVLLNIATTSVPDFFADPSDLALQEDAFVNTLSVVTTTTVGNTTTIVITGGGGNGTFSTAAVPEPASMALLGSGLIGLAGIVRRRRNKA